MRSLGQQCAVCSVYLHCVQCAVFSVQCSVFCARCAVRGVQYHLRRVLEERVPHHYVFSVASMEVLELLGLGGHREVSVI